MDTMSYSSSFLFLPFPFLFLFLSFVPKAKLPKLIDAVFSFPSAPEKKVNTVPSDIYMQMSLASAKIISQ